MMNENRISVVHQMAKDLMPVIYKEAMRTGEEDGLFQHDDWRTGIALDAYLIAEAFEKVSTAWEIKHK